MSSLHLRVTANPKQAGLVRDRLLQYCRANMVPPADSEDFVTAISEAFANAVEHAHTLDPIVVDLRIDDDDKLIAIISDDGRGFDMKKAESMLPPAGAERGRGIPLMRRYSDLFALRSHPGEGTVVTLIRYIHSPRGLTGRSLARGRGTPLA
ncbi:MAG: ATP-binding protein [Candidatus Eremiobacteraeota bacterium]|nr:ATP-binding protein [Candidatus Eremiobacteraeota bacterium]